MLLQLAVGRHELLARLLGVGGGFDERLDALLHVAERAGLPVEEVRAAERGSVSHNERRVADFLWSQLRTSAQLNGATDIALTFADYIDGRNRLASRFEQLTDETLRFIEEMEAVAAAPVSLISTRFDGRGLIDKRGW